MRFYKGMNLCHIWPGAPLPFLPAYSHSNFQLPCSMKSLTSLADLREPGHWIVNVPFKCPIVPPRTPFPWLILQNMCFSVLSLICIKPLHVREFSQDHFYWSLVQYLALRKASNSDGWVLNLHLLFIIMHVSFIFSFLLIPIPLSSLGWHNSSKNSSGSSFSFQLNPIGGVSKGY